MHGPGDAFLKRAVRKYGKRENRIESEEFFHYFSVIAEVIDNNRYLG